MSVRMRPLTATTQAPKERAVKQNEATALHLQVSWSNPRRENWKRVQIWFWSLPSGVRMILAGGPGFVGSWVVVWALYELQVAVVAIALISGLFGRVLNFFPKKLFVFQCWTKTNRGEIGRYAKVAITLVLLSTFVITPLKAYLAWPYLLAWALAECVTISSEFFCEKEAVFV